MIVTGSSVENEDNTICVWLRDRPRPPIDWEKTLRHVGGYALKLMNIVVIAAAIAMFLQNQVSNIKSLNAYITLLTSLGTRVSTSTDARSNP